MVLLKNVSLLFISCDSTPINIAAATTKIGHIKISGNIKANLIKNMLRFMEHIL